MVVCETLPLCPDTVLEASSDVLTEPVEVGPFREGIVFLSVLETTGATVRAEIGISPSGYEDWADHWVAIDTLEAGAGMHARRLSNFGNWLRLRLSLADADGTATALAWFVGKG